MDCVCSRDAFYFVFLLLLISFTIKWMAHDTSSSRDAKRLRHKSRLLQELLLLFGINQRLPCEIISPLICKNSRQQPQYRQHGTLEPGHKRKWLDEKYISILVRREGSICSVDTIFAYALCVRNIGKKRQGNFVESCETFLILQLWLSILLLIYRPAANLSLRFFFRKRLGFWKVWDQNQKNQFWVSPRLKWIFSPSPTIHALLLQILCFSFEWIFPSPTLFVLSHLTFIMYCLLPSWWFSERYIVMRAISFFFSMIRAFPFRLCS